MTRAILFQSDFNYLLESWQNRRLDDNARGGTAYEYQVLAALEGEHEVHVDPLAVRGASERSLKYAFRLLSARNQADLCLQTPSIVLYGKKTANARNVAIVHHIYLKEKYSSLKGRLTLALLHHKLRRLDCVVVVSEYWRRYFVGIGCKQVKVIYNAFDLDDYLVTQEEMEAFRAKYELPGDKPIIYLGLDKYGKGVKEALQALENLDYHFVVTGDKEGGSPVKKLNLSKREYVCLLNTADVTILMPTIEEGWSRVAHESLLCRTPVIGSGIAGMRELLEGGKQLICPKLEALPSLLEQALKTRQKLSDDGYDYVKTLDLAYFQRAWRALIASL